MTSLSAPFFDLHRDLPREAPGDETSLRWALELAKTPSRARILDAGCGPGADLALFEKLRPAAALVGLDLHAPFIERIRQTLPHVTASVGDMLEPEGKFDLIWSAGAAYGPGILTALSAWRGHLAPNGAIAFSDCLWRTSRPSSAALAFWQKEYPDICHLSDHLSRLEQAGWQVRGARWLGKSAWSAYYKPLQARIDSLRPAASTELLAVLDDAQAEIDLWRAHGDDYGYYLTVVTPL
ncbi:class I SAM-dependent methyltransferase [Thioclava sp. FR2]|uniref:class I SAM-dependent methyltransferase n=1 Tax=Thioclava sp. FR2 TaxID=3445780 RepID=UPI003EBF9545